MVEKREIQLPLPEEAAVNRLKRALVAVGRFSSEGAHEVGGRVRFGFYWVQLRVSWKPDPRLAKTRVEMPEPKRLKVVLEATSRDLFGSGATTSVLRRYEQALQNLDNPAFKADRFGVAPWLLYGLPSIFLIIFILFLLLFFS